jgi:hypothetical protein
MQRCYLDGDTARLVFWALVFLLLGGMTIKKNRMLKMVPELGAKNTPAR